MISPGRSSQRVKLPGRRVPSIVVISVNVVILVSQIGRLSGEKDTKVHDEQTVSVKCKSNVKRNEIGREGKMIEKRRNGRHSKGDIEEGGEEGWRREKNRNCQQTFKSCAMSRLGWRSITRLRKTKYSLVPGSGSSRT